jgi:peptidyl-prolyl cis-trans isomerase C
MGIQKSLVVVGVIAAGAAGFLWFNQQQHREKNEEVEVGEVFATSKVGKISVVDTEKYLRNLNSLMGGDEGGINLGSLKEEERRLLAISIFNDRILLQEAKRLHLHKTARYTSKLVLTRENLLKDMLLEDMIRKNVTSEMIKDKYASMVEAAKGKKEFDVSHILVKDEKTIKTAMKKLANISFVEAVKEFTTDASSRDNGGHIGWVMEGDLKEFDDVLKKLPLHKISQPFQTKIGWHILIKNDERDAVMPEFEKIKVKLKAHLVREFIRENTAKNTDNLDIKVVY